MRLPIERVIWQRIQMLQGKDILTIQNGKRNRIQYVSTSDITIDGRKTRPTRVDVEVYCTILDSDGIITKKNRPPFGPPNGWSGGHKTGRIIMAILASALPEYIEAFSQDNPYEPGLSGIRLK